MFSEFLLPTVWMESTLFQLHNYMPWGLAIISGTLLFRTVGTLPFAIKERKRLLRYTKILPLLNSWENTVKKIPKLASKETSNVDVERAEFRMLRTRQRFLFRKFDCNPFKGLVLPLIQFPLFLSMTYTIRNISGAKFLWFDPPMNAVKGMENEGFLFIEDLSHADPTLILPILVTASHLWNVNVMLIDIAQCKIEGRYESESNRSIRLARFEFVDVLRITACSCSNDHLSRALHCIG
jgi:membrane protein insertase Oxa1/YidC/SpoIIIJ